MVAVADGGQPLNVRAEQSGEHLGLRLAQLGELGGDVRNRAVVLAQLLPVPPRRAIDGGGKAVDRQCLRERTRLVLRRGRRHRGLIPLLEVGQPAARELHDGVLAADHCELSHRLDGEVVVGLRERSPAGLGQGEDLGWSTPAA